MIQSVLSFVGMAFLFFALFISGVVCGLNTLRKEAPDLYAEWTRRRAAK